MSFARPGRILGILLLLCLEAPSTKAKLQPIKPGCRYEGRRYQEGAPVSTSEPCLQCRCTEGALRCRLRVCPRLPSPPPPGCRLRPPGENVCCADLICGQSRDTGNMLRRSNVATEEEIDSDEESRGTHSEGCLHDGVRYGPGSAMMGSRRCEYCYCISGARRCIRPKCLLPLPGCTALYAPHSCCPVAYNCTHTYSSTAAPVAGNGCRVRERLYEEGEMVREIEWKAACDNCFCAMGAVRCVPLACAPPLQGCSPIVRQGQCCPSTYNCSGSIAVKATQNYASYAFISKDYAKFRKETNFFPATDQTTSPVEGRGHRVVQELIDTSTLQPEDQSPIVTESTAWPSTLETDTMDNEILVETVDYTKSGLEITTTIAATIDESTTGIESSTSEATSLRQTEDSTEELSTTTSVSLTSTPYPEFTSAVTKEDVTSTETVTATSIEQPRTDVPLTSTQGNLTGVEQVKIVGIPFGPNGMDGTIQGTLENFGNATLQRVDDSRHANVTVTIDTPNETDVLQRKEGPGSKLAMSKPSSSSIMMPDSTLVMNVTVRTNVSVGHIQGVTINPIRSIPPDVEAILNITHREKGEEYDYDYSEPTLPPSLPNVRIIPFVAADALVKEKTVPSAVTGYPSGSVVVSPELRPTDTSGFYDMATQENRFSPPVETEGGFVPREPPYFDAPYHSTDLNLEIGTGVTVLPAPITNPRRKNDASNCLFESLEYRHGDILPSTGICAICMCYYGEVVCSREKCAPLKIGCRRINNEEQCCGKIVCVDAEESPTVVLDRADASAPSQHQPIVSPDPFRDVIKTEPAPDLPSLIEDMIPYLVEHRITTPRPPSSTTTTTKSMPSPAHHQHPPPSGFDYIEKLSLLRPPFNYREEAIDRPFILANNNKYGRPSEPILPSYSPKNPDQSPEHAPAIPETFHREMAGPASPNQTAEQDTLSNSNRSSSNGDDNSRSSPRTEAPTGSTTQSTTTEDPIFSLDSVLDLLFSSDSSKPAAEATSLRTESTTGPLPATHQNHHQLESPSKLLDNEIPSSVASLLKLAGCNIYGRMYRVGRIITELSGPCLECRCTEIGVQCKQLEC